MSGLLWFAALIVLCEPGDHVVLFLFLVFVACGVSDLERKRRR